MELEFFGAAREVTGSCHILRVGGKQVLLDCGLIQGGKKAEARNREPFPFEAGEIDVTHDDPVQPPLLLLEVSDEALAVFQYGLHRRLVCPSPRAPGMIHARSGA